MTNKLDLLEQDIVSLLVKQEPNMLRWNEIVESLWQIYKFKYKAEKGFGVAVTNKLRLLVAARNIKHQEIYYGTLSSRLPESTVMLSFEGSVSSRTNFQKASKEATFVQPIGVSEKYYCEKCGEQIPERIHTGGPPSNWKFKCLSCGFENNISKAYANEKRDCTVRKEQTSSVPRIVETKSCGVIGGVLYEDAVKAEAQLRNISVIHEELEEKQETAKQESGPRGFTESPSIFLTGEEYDQLRKVMEELRREELRFFREPTVNEVALKAGKDPELVTVFLDRLAEQGRWKMQSQQQAEREAKDAIDLAGWLCWKEKREQNSKLEGLYRQAINSASADTLRRAQDILKNYPDIVPKVTLVEPKWFHKAIKRPTGKGIVVPFNENNLAALEWPEETKKKWREVCGSEPPLFQYWE